MNAERLLTETEAKQIANFSLGIPFAVSLAAAMWQDNKPIAEIIAPVPFQLGQRSDRQQIVREMSERFLKHCFDQQDLRTVYTLALMRRPDPELLKAMLDVDDLGRELRSLQARYSFMWADRCRLDEKLATFLREYLLEERHLDDTIQQVNETAIAALQLTVEARCRDRTDIAEQFADEPLAETLAALAYHCFWRSEEEGWRYWVPHFVAGWQYDRSWTRTVLEAIELFAPTFSQAGQHRL